MDRPPPDPAGELAGLRFLRRLVTVLTAAMIAGVAALVVLLAMRLTAPPPPALPERVRLPEGVTAQAVTFGAGWYAVVTRAGEILVFDADTGALRQRTAIAPAD